MSRTRSKIITTLVAAIAIASLAPAASIAGASQGERTPTELGQAVGEPADQTDAAANAPYSRTPTELGQRVATSVAPAVEASGGFDLGDAAIGAGAMLALLGLGGSLAVVLVNRRRHALGDRVPAVSG